MFYYKKTLIDFFKFVDIINKQILVYNFSIMINAKLHKNLLEHEKSLIIDVKGKKKKI